MEQSGRLRTGDALEVAQAARLSAACEDVKSLPIAPQFVQGTADGAAGGAGAVFLSGDLLSLFHGAARGIGRLRAQPGVGGDLSRRKAGDLAEQE